MKKFLSLLLSSLIIFAISLPVFADDPDDFIFDYDIETEDAFYDDSVIPDERLLPRLVDDADLLTDSEETSLLAKLDEISERQKCDICIVTVTSIGSKRLEDFADDFYDYNGYGFGENSDGIMLLINTSVADDRYVSTCGLGIYAVTDDNLQEISNKVTPELKSGNYMVAFDKFADLCDGYISRVDTEAYYNGEIPTVKPAFDPLKKLLISLAIGFIISLIVVLIMKGKLKSVKMQNSAANYTKPGSMNITESRDMFLYANVTKTAKSQDTGSSGGSRTHTSSSGRTHGGGRI